MFRMVLLQAAATLVAALIAALVGGAPAAVSTGLGGLACVVPNALFAWRLALRAKSPQGASVGTFFAGEFIKLAATVALLFAIAKIYPALNWLALLVGFIVGMKSYLFAILIDRHH